MTVTGAAALAEAAGFFPVLAAVSYTHLDVYKRHVLGLGVALGLGLLGWGLAGRRADK